MRSNDLADREAAVWCFGDADLARFVLDRCGVDEALSIERHAAACELCRMTLAAMRSAHAEAEAEAVEV